MLPNNRVSMIINFGYYGQSITLGVNYEKYIKTIGSIEYKTKIQIWNSILQNYMCI